VNLLSPVAGLHVALTANKDEEKRLLSDFGHGARALSARADVNIRRRMAGLRAPDTGLPLANPNTDMALYREAKETMAAFLRERHSLAAPSDLKKSCHIFGTIWLLHCDNRIPLVD